MARNLRCTPILVARYRFPFPPLYNARERNWEPPSNSVTDGTSKSVSTLRAWDAQRQEQQHAYEMQRADEEQHIHQVRLEVAGAVLPIVIVVIVLLLIVTRTRLAIGSFIARGIYAVSGFDVRKISERWDGYRRRDQEDRNQQAAERKPCGMVFRKPKKAPDTIGDPLQERGSLIAYDHPAQLTHQYSRTTAIGVHGHTRLTVRCSWSGGLLPRLPPLNQFCP
jgi:hypothetical protein